MRPPQKTGENIQRHKNASWSKAVFNEAPAEDGGKLIRDRVWQILSDSSMRPPQKTGENLL